MRPLSLHAWRRGGEGGGADKKAAEAAITNPLMSKLRKEGTREGVTRMANSPSPPPCPRKCSCKKGREGALQRASLSSANWETGLDKYLVKGGTWHPLFLSLVHRVQNGTCPCSIKRMPRFMESHKGTLHFLGVHLPSLKFKAFATKYF